MHCSHTQTTAIASTRMARTPIALLCGAGILRPPRCEDLMLHRLAAAIQAHLHNLQTAGKALRPPGSNMLGLKCGAAARRVSRQTPCQKTLRASVPAAASSAEPHRSFVVCTLLCTTSTAESSEHQNPPVGFSTQSPERTRCPMSSLRLRRQLPCSAMNNERAYCLGNMVPLYTCTPSAATCGPSACTGRRMASAHRVDSALGFRV